MRHLSIKGLECLKNRVVFLFLDYDGTLVPIADTPDKASLSAEGREILGKIADNAEMRVAVISGRPLSDIKKMVGIEGIIYAGNHGLEIEGPRIKFTRPFSLKYRSILERIKKEISLELARFRGALLEDKGLSLSIHYRLVDGRKVPLLKAATHGVVAPYLVRKKIKIKPGKKVIEIRPPVEWDKGKVALWLMAGAEFAARGRSVLPVYIGDDISDEDAFGVLKNKGFTVFVGNPRGKSRAEYYLKDTREVWEFLKKVLERR